MVRYIISQGLIPVKLFFLHFIRALTSILCNIGTINQNVTSKKTVILSAVRSTKSKNLMEILRLGRVFRKQIPYIKPTLPVRTSFSFCSPEVSTQDDKATPQPITHNSTLTVPSAAIESGVTQHSTASTFTPNRAAVRNASPNSG